MKIVPRKIRFIAIIYRYERKGEAGFTLAHFAHIVRQTKQTHQGGGYRS